MATGNQGLGSDNMSQTDKDKIHSMGGKASGGNNSRSASTGSSNVTKNSSGGGGIDKDAQKRGGQNSRRS
ncbi:MAG TPA: hypothetical protein VF575_05620 [Candidatus Saccharimonadales bacterium]|jgi:hypothetical protein